MDSGFPSYFGQCFRHSLLIVLMLKKTHHLGRPILLQRCVHALSGRELLRLWEEGEDEQGASGDY